MLPQSLIGLDLDGRFTLKDVLGIGGMGAVYRAEQRSMGRDVAIKVLRTDMVADENAIHRFLTEAKAASRLKNPHTVTVFDFGRAPDGVLYIAMELMEGRTLGQLLTDLKHPLSLLRACRIVNQILDSLEEAHAVGVLHRDLKPDNIFMLEGHGARDFVKVLDFGVAKVVGATNVATTKAGLAFGTPVYMSPEQMMGRDVDPRSDLYSLGVLLFEMLAGRPPVEGDSPLAVALRKVREPAPEVRQVRPDAESNDVIDDLLQRVLSSNPEDRPEDVAEFRNILVQGMEIIPRTGRSDRSGSTGRRRPVQPPADTETRTEVPGKAAWERATTVAQSPGRPRESAPDPIADLDTVQTPTPLPALPPDLAAPSGTPPIEKPARTPTAANAGSATAPSASTPAKAPQKDALPHSAARKRDAVEDRIHKPVSQVLNRPPTVLPQDRREAGRVRHLMSVVCVMGGQPQNALLAEVNIRGGFIHATWIPPEHQRMAVVFKSEGQSGPYVTAVVEVIRVIKAPRVAGELKGFSFRWLSLKSQGRLSDLVEFFRRTFNQDMDHHLPLDTVASYWEYSFAERRLVKQA
jgi:serine/threonine-protein kinase